MPYDALQVTVDPGQAGDVNLDFIQSLSDRRVIPEPATLALGWVGVGGLGPSWRRREVQA